MHPLESNKSNSKGCTPLLTYSQSITYFLKVNLPFQLTFLQIHLERLTQVVVLSYQLLLFSELLTDNHYFLPLRNQYNGQLLVYPLLKFAELVMLQLHNLSHTDKHSNCNRNEEFLPTLNRSLHQTRRFLRNISCLNHNKLLLKIPPLMVFLLDQAYGYHVQTLQTSFDGKLFL